MRWLYHRWELMITFIRQVDDQILYGKVVQEFCEGEFDAKVACDTVLNSLVYMDKRPGVSIIFY